MNENRKIEQLLRQLVENQDRVLAELGELKRRTSELEKRLNQERRQPSPSRGLTPALVKVLSELERVGGESDVSQIAEKLHVSRNIANVYLNRLIEMEYVDKLPNPDPTRKAKYIYSLRKDKLDERLKALLEKVRL
ncbi:MAG: MarR family transcriptional regulator [Candidatus Caldarchaeum sp.]